MGWDFDLGLWGFKSFFFNFYFLILCPKIGIFNFVKREKKELTESQSGKKKKNKEEKETRHKHNRSKFHHFFCFL